MITTKKYARKPFYVDAVQVNVENILDVAKWCQGVVIGDPANPEGAHIKVRVHRPLTERQTKAFIGDWVLYAGTGYKVYTQKAFEKSFEPVKTLTKAQADEAGIRPPIEPKAAPKPNQVTITPKVTPTPEEPVDPEVAAFFAEAEKS